MRSRADWRSLSANQPEDWQVALQVDQQIRNALPPSPLYLHPSMKPLQEAVQIPPDAVPGLFELECESGYCFL